MTLRAEQKRSPTEDARESGILAVVAQRRFVSCYPFPLREIRVAARPFGSYNIDKVHVSIQPLPLTHAGDVHSC